MGVRRRERGLSEEDPAATRTDPPGRWGWRVVATLWTVCTVAALWMPPPPNPGLDWPWLDEAIHFVLFGGAAGLWSLAALPGRVIAIGAVVLAASTELGQGLLPWDRHPDPIDFGFDVVGAALGWTLVWLLRRLSRATTDRR